MIKNDQIPENIISILNNIQKNYEALNHAVKNIPLMGGLETFEEIKKIEGSFTIRMTLSKVYSKD